MKKNWIDFIKGISESELDDFIKMLSQKKKLYIHYVTKTYFLNLIVDRLNDEGHIVNLSDITPRVVFRYSNRKDNEALKRVSIIYNFLFKDKEVLDFCEFDIDGFLMYLKRKKSLHSILKK